MSWDIGGAADTPASVDVSPNGWAAGGGVEWAFLPNWTLRAEYLHLQFDGVTEDRSKTGFFPGLVITSHVSSNVGVDLVRIGANYLFNFGRSSFGPRALNGCAIIGRVQQFEPGFGAKQKLTCLRWSKPLASAKSGAKSVASRPRQQAK